MFEGRDQPLARKQLQMLRRRCPKCLRRICRSTIGPTRRHCQTWTKSAARQAQHDGVFTEPHWPNGHHWTSLAIRLEDQPWIRLLVDGPDGALDAPVGDLAVVARQR